MFNEIPEDKEELKNKYRIVYHEYQSLFNKKKDEDDEDGFDGQFGEDEEIHSPSDLMNMDLMTEPFIISSEEALIPVKDYGPTKAVYNFWTAHTNFSITQDIVDIIDNIDGVETLEQFTRYRLRIGIGKLFTPRTVFSALDKAVFNYLKENKDLF